MFVDSTSSFAKEYSQKNGRKFRDDNCDNKAGNNIINLSCLLDN